MFPYDELIADLTKENLLDKAPVVFHKQTNSVNFINFSNHKLGVQNLDLLSNLEINKISIPDFFVVNPTDKLRQLEDRLSNSNLIDLSSLEAELNTPYIPNHYRPHPNKRKSNYCLVCHTQLPTNRIYCRLCNQKNLGNIIFVGFLIFSAVIIILFLFLGPENDLG